MHNKNPACEKNAEKHAEKYSGENNGEKNAEKAAQENTRKNNKTDFKKLEIGSGNKPRAGYLHFDIRKNINADVVGDAKKLPFKNSEFNEVYSRFFLEHLPRTDAKKALEEMNRVLEQKGVLEIIVPNLAYFCKLFIEEKGQKKEWALNKIYGFENYGEDHHYFGYDFETLEKLLKDTGFEEIKKMETEEQYLHIKAKKF